MWITEMEVIEQEGFIWNHQMRLCASEPSHPLSQSHVREAVKTSRTQIFYPSYCTLSEESSNTSGGSPQTRVIEPGIRTGDAICIDGYFAYLVSSRLD